MRLIAFWGGVFILLALSGENAKGVSTDGSPTMFCNRLNIGFLCHPMRSDDRLTMEMMMKTHELKIWPQWFDAVRIGSKTFEIRKDDRNYQVGDKLILSEFRVGVGEYTGRKLEKTIKYISRPTDSERASDNIEAIEGLAKGYCVLGIS